MKNQPTVFVLSDNHDFIEALSSIVTHELSAACIAISTKEEIAPRATSVLVTNVHTDEDYTIPTIKINLPIRLNRLVTDIKTLFSRTTVETIDITTDFSLSPQHKTLTHKANGKVIDLTDKESQLLQIIVKSGEAGISREQLLKEIWKIDAELDTHTLETHIYRLRKKIKDAFENNMIKAIEGGYKL